MKNLYKAIIIMALFLIISCKSEQAEWIRINQLGYRNNDIKVAVLLSKKEVDLKSFKVIDVKSGEVA